MSVFNHLRPSTFSLRSTLALYIIPISILPVIALSWYASYLFKKNTMNFLISRAESERTQIIQGIQEWQKGILTETKRQATQAELVHALKKKKHEDIRFQLKKIITSHESARVYSPQAKLIAKAGKNTHALILPQEAQQRLWRYGAFITYAPIENKKTKGLLFLVRAQVRDKGQVLGTLEKEYWFHSRVLTQITQNSLVNLVLLDEKFRVMTSSFSLGKKSLDAVPDTLFQKAKQNNNLKPEKKRIGSEDYAVFVYDFPQVRKQLKAGYVALFVSVNSVEGPMLKLRMAIITISGIIILLLVFLIFLISRRLTQPIEALVGAMKSVRTGQVSQIPELDSAYEIEYLIKSFNDMASRITLTKNQLESNIQELHQANSDITSAQTSLVQSAKMASLGQIVAGVAHELNNPIGFIYSNMYHLSDYVQKLKTMFGEYQKVHGLLPEKEKKKIEEEIKSLDIPFVLEDIEELTKSCVDGSKRIKDIVLGLKTFSRTDESHFEYLDIHVGLRSTLKIMKTQVKDRIKIHTDFESLPPVECNLSKLNQVFMNLISNAGHAIEEKGNIWIKTKNLGDWVCVEIEDDGKGMSAEQIEKIFDPFYTTKKVGQGTGLGLSIAYGLIQDHNGKITVESEEGKGTLFRLELPVDQPRE